MHTVPCFAPFGGIPALHHHWAILQTTLFLRLLVCCTDWRNPGTLASPHSVESRFCTTIGLYCRLPLFLRSFVCCADWRNLLWPDFIGQVYPSLSRVLPYLDTTYAWYFHISGIVPFGGFPVCTTVVTYSSPILLAHFAIWRNHGFAPPIWLY